MPEHRFDIGVIVARRRLDSPWADHSWLPHALVASVPAAAPGTPLGAVGTNELFYAGAVELWLDPAQAAHYADNLGSGRPSLWVQLRLGADGGYALSRVTADPYEGEALTEGIGGIVEALPMPPELVDAVAAFVAAFHVERPFLKRERDRADPDGLGYRPAAGLKRGQPA